LDSQDSFFHKSDSDGPGEKSGAKRRVRCPKWVKSSVSASPSAAAVTGSTATATPGGRGLVWVNTETHVYHKDGSRFYGTTKKGKYVSEADAIKEGDRAAAKER
jgi:hypothetical protein